MKIAIVDSGSGNLRSVENAFAHLGADAHLTADPSAIAVAQALVLPGQGAFGDAMRGLQERELVEPIQSFVRSGRPVLGICIGLQLFFEASEESPGVCGLGLLPGKVVKFTGENYGAVSGLKVPQMGWNKLDFPVRHPLFEGLEAGASVYFVHSFYAVPQKPSDLLATCDYGQRVCAAAGRDNIVGCQFHPEKSQRVGLKILRNFIAAL